MRWRTEEEKKESTPSKKLSPVVVSGDQIGNTQHRNVLSQASPLRAADFLSTLLIRGQSFVAFFNFQDAERRAKK